MPSAVIFLAHSKHKHFEFHKINKVHVNVIIYIQRLKILLFATTFVILLYYKWIYEHILQGYFDIAIINVAIVIITFWLVYCIASAIIE